MNLAMLKTIKRGLKKLVPQKVRQLRRRLAAMRRVRQFAHYDWVRYSRSSGIMQFEAAVVQPDAAVLKAQLFRYEHVLEKALSFHNPRVGFGAWVIDKLLSTLPAYLAVAGGDDTVCMVRRALERYVEFHRQSGARSPRESDVLTLLAKLPGPTQCPGASQEPALERSREDIWGNAKIDFESFAMCRHSIRDFAPEPVPEEAIQRAARMAQRSPSACNRQGGRLHVYSRPEHRDKILNLQSGNRGFGHLASHVILMTVDLRCFVDAVERHQAWIDGGLFAMSFMYGIHSLGYGSCPLHWSVDEETDRKMRVAAKIPEPEEIIMLLAIGSLRERFKVAAAMRNPLEAALKFH